MSDGYANHMVGSSARGSAGNSLGQAISAAKPPELAQIAQRLEQLCDSARVTCQRLRGVGDRAFGGTPETGKDQNKPYPSGAIGSIQSQLDTLTDGLTALGFESDRLERLV